jgi:hypothetical protein
MLFCGSALAGYFDDLQHPMTVVVVRASDKRCEPNCPQWIAAEGKIDASAVEKFRKLLANIGGGRYPILIDSTGGDFDAAIEIARLIQSNSLMVAVSTTGYVGCTPTKEFCSNPHPADAAYKGFPIFQGYCGGACVVVLAAGKVRAAGSAMAVVVEHGNSINLGGPARCGRGSRPSFSFVGSEFRSIEDDIRDNRRRPKQPFSRRAHLFQFDQHTVVGR